MFRRTHLVRSKNFEMVQLGTLHNLGPGPFQILFRSWFDTNIPSKHFGSVQRRFNIYFRQSGNLHKIMIFVELLFLSNENVPIIGCVFTQIFPPKSSFRHFSDCKRRYHGIIRERSCKILSMKLNQIILHLFIDSHYITPVYR